MHHYVIVGGGTAGSVLAHRLSEDAAVRVLLLKRDPAHRSLKRTTVPQPGLFERRLREPGDDAATRAPSPAPSIALHSPPGAYEQWASVGGWSHAAVRPYLSSLEAHTGTGNRPLVVADGPAPHPLTQAFVRAAAGAGLPFTANLRWPPRRGGAGLHRVAQMVGRVRRAATAYLRAARDRPNLTVVGGASPHHLTVQDGRVTGVRYVEDGLQWSADAEHAVIVCAGAAGSPHLLMRSGIGPADHLEARGVEVTCDRPGVGRGLQVPLAADLTGHADGPAWPRHAPPAASAFLRSSPEAALPNLQLRFGPAPSKAMSRSGSATSDRVPFTVRCALLHPQSRGRVTLRPDRPGAPPVLDPHAFHAPADPATLVAGLRRARHVLSQPPFARFTPTEGRPGLARTADAELRGYLRLHAERAGPAAGTCRMGSGTRAVVDTALRVRGMENLRVADASVFPAAVRGSTALPLIVLAERAADLLLGRPAPAPSQPRILT